MKHDWFFYKEVFSLEQCEEIVRVAFENRTTLPDSPAYNKNTNTFVCNRKSFGELLDPFFETVIECNRSNFGLEIYPSLPVNVNINHYFGNKNEYGWHRDFKDYGDMSDIKLTGILNLSTKEYTGGEFEIRIDEERTIPEINEPGSLLVFPSFFFHRVKPVTAGERITLSCWFDGPNFK